MRIARSLCSLVFGASLVAAPLSAQITVLNFDALGNLVAVPSNYGGVSWDLGWTSYTAGGFPFTPHSAPASIFNASAGQIGFSFATPTVFQGAWFSGYSYGMVNFKLSLGSSTVWTSSVLSPSDVPAFLGSGYTGLVDRVEIVEAARGAWVMDDVTFGSATSVTPEPASMALLGTGLIGIAGVARRRRRKA